jgi:hypothetical protein
MDYRQQVKIMARMDKTQVEQIGASTIGRFRLGADIGPVTMCVSFLRYSVVLS